MKVPLGLPIAIGIVVKKPRIKLNWVIKRRIKKPPTGAEVNEEPTIPRKSGEELDEVKINDVFVIDY